MSQVMPDKISIRTVRNRAVVTAVCRTLRSKPVEYRPGIHPEITFPMTKISPDPVKILSGHEESIGVLQKGNMSHPSGVFTGASYRISLK